MHQVPHELTPPATAIYADKALPTAGVPRPPFLITGDMCVLGKPNPEPYLRGAQVLGLDPTECETNGAVA
jgi:sugar-phosphatase